MGVDGWVGWFVRIQADVWVRVDRSLANQNSIFVAMVKLVAFAVESGNEGWERKNSRRQ